MAAPSKTATGREYGVAPGGYRLPDATRPGTVRLATGDFDRTVAFYESVLGLVPAVTPDGATLHAGDASGEPLLDFVHIPGLKPVPPAGQLGLYHVAIRVPDRPALGRFVAHLREQRVPFGAGDHLVSEAIYFTDPNGFGLEVYVDRPRGTWEAANGELVMATERVNLSDVLKAAGEPQPWTGLPSGTVIGHIHLQVDDLRRAEQFYHERIGLDKTVWSYPGALFMAAGGYHHHLAVNTWGRNLSPASDGEARLLEWSLVVPTGEDLDRLSEGLAADGQKVITENGSLLLSDPWGTQLRMRVQPSEA